MNAEIVARIEASYAPDTRLDDIERKLDRLLGASTSPMPIGLEIKGTGKIDIDAIVESLKRAAQDGKLPI